MVGVAQAGKAMKIALLDARQGTRDPEASLTVAYRNMMVLAKELNAPLYADAAGLRGAPDHFDAIICGFGSTSCERTESVAFLKRNPQAQLWWLVGEYEQSTFAPLFYVGRKYGVFRNFEHPLQNKQAKQQAFINLNALLAKPCLNPLKTRKHRAVYYGRWRKDRARYFGQYIGRNCWLSTSPKNMKIFASIGIAPRYARGMSWIAGQETLRQFAASLYLEDTYTHTHYNCPANRYYEALWCGVPLLFQRESINTWDKYGIQIPTQYVVRCAADVDAMATRLSHPQEIAAALAWQAPLEARALDDKRNALNQIKRALGIAQQEQRLPQQSQPQDHGATADRTQDFAKHLLRTKLRPEPDQVAEILQQT